MPASDTPELPFETPRRWALAREPGGEKPASQEPASQAPPSKPAGEKLELFQAPAEKAGEGYARWKAEMADARKAEAAARRAAELPVAADNGGYAAWKADAEKARRDFEQRWSVPLGKPVRIQLRGELREREGILRADEGTAPRDSRHLRLRMGDHCFSAAQIESLVRL